MKKLWVLLVAFLLFPVLFLFSEQIPDVQNPFLERGDMRFDSLNVRLEGSWPFGVSSAVSQDSLRSIAFCASGGGVYCLDVSDPRNPAKISEAIHARSFIFHLFYKYSAQQLFIGSDPNSFEIWDVSDAVNPQKLGEWLAPGGLTDIFVVDTLAYVTVIDSGLYIIDVSNPSNPQQIGYFNKIGLYAVYVEGAYAYVGSYDFCVVDISNPTNPQLVTSYHPFHLGITDIDIQGSYAYVATPYGTDTTNLKLIDISVPSNPYLFSSCTTTAFDPYNIDVAGSYVYVADYYGLAVVDVSDPLNPHQIGFCECAARDVTVSGSYAFISMWSFSVIDVTPPNNPRQVGQYEIPNEALDIFVSNPYIYVADHYSGLRIIDYSNPSVPFEIGNHLFDGCASAVSVNGSYAFVCDENPPNDSMALRIFDVSDPTNPQQMSICYSPVKPGWARGIDILGSYAYIGMRSWFVGSEDGLWIVDISNPSNPYEVGFFVTSNDDVFDVFVIDTLAFLAAENFYIVNVSDPVNPVQIGFFDTEYAHGVCVSGSYAYVMDAFVGVLIFDISDPTNPQQIGSYTPQKNPSKCCIDGSLLYVTDRGDGYLRVLDVSSPSNPQEVGYYQLNQSNNVFFEDPYVFVADGAQGVQILEVLGTGIGEEEKDYTNMPSLHLLQNPIRDSNINILLSLSHPVNAEIALYNQIGQRVKTFQFSGLKVGQNRLELDVQELTSGVYFIKVQNIANLPTIKLLLIK